MSDTSPSDQAPRTLGDRLAQARRARFIGRTAELARFERMLDGAAEPVWFLHGPGGMGKTTLLRELARRAETRQRVVIEIDARNVKPTPAGWRDALAAAAHAAGDEPLPASTVLLVDTFESIASLEPWLRESELPRYPGDALVVLAGRTPADPQWRLDPGWSAVACVTTLASWTPAEARDYWSTRIPDAALPEAVLVQGRGHPLLLSLLADAQRHGHEPAAYASTDRAELVRQLLSRFAADLSDPLHREAFNVLILARTVTEAMLADAVDGAAAARLLSWLRGLPFAEANAFEVKMHDFVRESFAADWAARDPAALEGVLLRLLQHVKRCVTRCGTEARPRYFQDWNYLQRYRPTGRFLDTRGLDECVGDALNPVDADGRGDGADALDLVTTRLGAQSAASMRYWLRRAPGAFRVVRRADGRLQGIYLALELLQLTPEDLNGDPPLAACMDYVRRVREPAPGASVLVTRLMIDRDSDALPNITSNVSTSEIALRTLLTPQQEWNLNIHHNAAAVAAMYASFTRFWWHRPALELAFEADGHSWGVFVRDFFAEPLPTQWRAPRGDGSEALLSRDEFGRAVREALKHYARDDRLAQNALLSARCMLGSGGTTSIELLRQGIAQAIDSFAAHPGDRKFQRALRRTWLEPGAKQEAVAEDLGLPFNTYRYHLARGGERLVELLWQRELRTEAQDREAAEDR